MSEELLPCPFCGSEAQMIEGTGAFGGRVQIDCTNCRNATWWWDEAVAVKSWNRRDTPAVHRAAEKEPDKRYRALMARYKNVLELNARLEKYIQEHATPLPRASDAAVPEGCTPADAAMLREANHALAAENDRLRRALAPFARVVSTDKLSWAVVECCVEGDPEKQTFRHPQMQRAFNRAADLLRENVDESAPQQLAEPTQEVVQPDERAAFEAACDALPDGVSWGDRLTPGIVQYIMARAAAPQLAGDDKRAAFEAWARDEGIDVSRGFHRDNYADATTERLWDVWQAARASAPHRAAAEPCWLIHEKDLLHIMSVAIGAAYVSVDDAAKRLNVKTLARAAALQADNEELARKDRTIAFLRDQNRRIIEAAERIRTQSLARAAGPQGTDAAPQAERRAECAHDYVRTDGVCTECGDRAIRYQWRDTGPLETEGD